MEHIVIDPASLTIDLTRELPEDGIAIPTELPYAYRRESPLATVVYRDILYRIVYEEDKKKRHRVVYKLAEPDPWLLAIAAIMWEGLLQGLTWDIIKTSVLHALAFLRSKGLAPSPAPPHTVTEDKRQSRSRTQLGFSWVRYSEDGKPLEEFFFGIKREFQKTDDQKRRLLTRLKKRPPA